MMMLLLLKLVKTGDNNTFRRHLINGVVNQKRYKSCVYSFGDGSNGALGLPTVMGSDSYEPSVVPSLPSDVSAVAAGHYHSLAVTSQGQLWAWGRNNEAQLGRGFDSPRGTWYEPKRVEGLDQVAVQNAFASGVISVAIGVDGSMWVWGKSKRGQLCLGKGITEAIVPTRVEVLAGEEIAKVSLGWGHALALTKDGKLFGWGYSADGRLGRIGNTREDSSLESRAGMLKITEDNKSSTLETAEKLVLEAMEKEKDMPIVWEPCLIEELRGVEVTDMACGLDHSLILCRDGTLFSSGSNIYGQLGRSAPNMGLLPVEISFNSVSVASGLGHSLAICKDLCAKKANDSTKIVSWGWNCSSQLGREGPENLPVMVEALAEENPISVSGGRVHSIALTSKREVWVWGCGRNGRLGLGSSSDEVEPVLLDNLEDRNVLQVMSGFDHNLVLTSE